MEALEARARFGLVNLQREREIGEKRDESSIFIDPQNPESTPNSNYSAFHWKLAVTCVQPGVTNGCKLDAVRDWYFCQPSWHYISYYISLKS